MKVKTLLAITTVLFIASLPLTALSANDADEIKICVMAEEASQDKITDTVIRALVKPTGVKLRTLLPAKAKELRDDPAKARGLGYTHILYVNAVYTSSRRGKHTIRQAYLSLKLYEVSTEEVINSWAYRGVGLDPNGQANALESATEQAAKILDWLRE